MKIDKIVIKIKDTGHFADVAILVDREDFLENVNKLRQKWKIYELFNPTDFLNFYSYIWGKEKSPERWAEFKQDIKELRASFNRSPNFDEVIMHAITFGVIPNGLYKSCYLEVIEDASDPDNESKYKYAIIVTPNTTIPDISLVLSEYKRRIKKGLEQKKNPKKWELAVSSYDFELGPQYTPRSKKSGDIKRDRNWYWLNKEGLSYGKIVIYMKNKGIKVTRRDVINAITAYRHRLSVSI